MSEGLISPLDDDVIEEKRDKLKVLLFRLAKDYDDDPDRTVEELSGYMTTITARCTLRYSR